MVEAHLPRGQAAIGRVPGLPFATWTQARSVPLTKSRRTADMHQQQGMQQQDFVFPSEARKEFA
jgi:hypothetical protein